VRKYISTRFSILSALLPGADRRERRACLTDIGARRLEDAETHWAEAQSRLHDAIGDEDPAALERISNEIEGLAGSSGR
jgi:DNA-binding MarR family transcriptional regulator